MNSKPRDTPDPQVLTIPLDRLFRLRDVNTLVLAGVATQFAVEGTAREAVDRGYRVVVLEDCCASRVREVHRFSIDMILRSLRTVTTAERFIRSLEGDAPDAGSTLVCGP